MQIKGKTYDVLKFIAQIGLPALGTFYFTLAGVWGLPSAEEVVATIVAIDTFLGVILQISSATFNANEVAAGTIQVQKGADDSSLYTLEFDGDPAEELSGKSRAVFDIRKE